MSTKMLLHRYLGADAAGGYANFFDPGTSTAKATYTSTTYATEQAADVAIDSNGWIKAYLLGDYDMDVFSAAGVQLSSASADGINPQEVTTTSDINLALNGSFETDSDGDDVPDNWVLTNYTGSTNARVSSDQRHGQYSMSFTSAGSGGGFIVSTDFILVNEDTNYNFAFSLISTDAGVRNLIEILWYDEGFTSISNTTIYDNSTTNPTSWTRYSYQVTPPADAKHAKIRMYGCHSSDATTGTTRYDDVRLTSASMPSAYEPVTHNADYTFTLSDLWLTHLKTAADTTTRTWTIPLNASVPFPVGAIIPMTNLDDNNLTIVADGAATLRELNKVTPADGSVVLREGESGYAFQDATNTWLFFRHGITANAVTNYVSGMRIYRNENGYNTTAFDVDGNVTESTFESVGPTGSSATNIWTAMDDIPAGARIAIISVILYVLGDESAVGFLGQVFARATGSSQAAANGQRIAFIQADNNNLTDVPEKGIQVQAMVPLDSSRRFDITWAASADAAVNIDIYLHGFVL